MLTRIQRIMQLGGLPKTTLDGFGRTIKQESGTGTYNSGSGPIALSTVVSTVDTAYDSCGCSPMGKLKQTSRPNAPGGTVYWTVYAYDGIGRTKTVTAPDGASTSRYSYSGATVTVTDEASKAKTFTTAVTGSLVQVQEANRGRFIRIRIAEQFVFRIPLGVFIRRHRDQLHSVDHSQFSSWVG